MRKLTRFLGILRKLTRFLGILRKLTRFLGIKLKNKVLKVKLTTRFIVENADVGTETVESIEDLTKGWSRSIVAVDLSAGFLWKQHWRKSFPSGDSFSGIGGALFNTLNIT